MDDSKKTQIGMLVRFLEMVEGEIDRLLDEEKSKVEGGSEANDTMEDLEDAAVGIEEAIDSLQKTIAANAVASPPTQVSPGLLMCAAQKSPESKMAAGQNPIPRASVNWG